MQTSKYEIGANLQGLEFRRQANEILAALASSNAGDLEPAATQAGTVWLDTSNNKKHLLKIRNKANSAWGILCSIDAQSGAVDKIDAYTKQESDDKFVLKTELTDGLPTGAYVLYSSNTNIPNGFLRCDGSSLDKTTYAALFAVIGYTYGRSGDKFLLPNFSDGKFMRGTGGNAAALGTVQQDAIRNIIGSVGANALANGGNVTNEGALYNDTQNVGNGSNAVSGGWHNNKIKFDASKVVPTANENRPYNMAVVVLIKY